MSEDFGGVLLSWMFSAACYGRMSSSLLFSFPWLPFFPFLFFSFFSRFYCRLVLVLSFLRFALRPVGVYPFIIARELTAFLFSFLLVPLCMFLSGYISCCYSWSLISLSCSFAKWLCKGSPSQKGSCGRALGWRSGQLRAVPRESRG